ncbi:MAG: hypothetical protein WKF67_08370 [Rubrobacteraceae bacterium]
MEVNKRRLTELTNASYSTVGQANELATRLESLARGTAEQDEATRIKVELGRLQGQLADLRHELQNG